MKLKATLTAAALLLTPALQAFTLDFAAYVGSTLPADLTINVPDYGDVVFSAGYASTLEVGTAFFGAPSIQFDNGELLYVTFLGSVPSNVDFSTIGLSSINGESFVVLQTGAQQFVVSLQNSTDGAGVGAVTFDAASSVPEPSAALLGSLGAAGMVLRRRRR